MNAPTRDPSRPAAIKDEYLTYLDNLRSSGRTNMFGAVQYLVLELKLSQALARQTWEYWTKTFGKASR